MNIFINPDEERFRAGWRLAGQLFFMLLIAMLLVPVLGAVLDGAFPVVPFALAAGALSSTILAAKGLDYRRWSTYGVGLDVIFGRNLIYGFMLGGAAMCLIFLIEYALGWLTITGYGWQAGQEPYLWSLAGYLCYMIIVGFWEELVFRGYQIINMSEGFNMPGTSRKKAAISAVAVSSVAFGLGHALNPNAGMVSTLNIIAAGVMLAFPFIITGRLAWSIGLHIGWNFFQGGIFGFAVSGQPSQASLIEIKQQGPVLLTGGAFGPEAGMLGLLGMAVVIGLLIIILKWSGYRLSVASTFGIYSKQPREALNLDEQTL